MAKISVVMAVFNGAATFPATMTSILEQTERDLEVIVVDDGSTDDTPSLLAEIARADERVRVLTQPNAGLTRALIRGCAEAQSPLIARHDCGDRSHPDRFRKQAEVLDREPDVVLVSCSTSFHAPGGEQLYVSAAEGEAVRHSLLHADVEHVRGLSHHGSAMFRRSTYTTAGGYRGEFRFAQDLDLWVRMAKLGRIAFVPEVLYEARVDVGAISTRNRPQQIESTRIALRLRDDDANRDALLVRAAAIGRERPRRSRSAEAGALYFMASCLRREKHPHWTRYARQALRRNPFLLRAWVLLLRGAP
jgi:glycosyltransferase involved in cell wall biosynthesis